MSGLPPSTILTFEKAVDQTLTIVTGISQDYLKTPRFNQVLALIDAQNQQLAQNAAQIQSLENDISNLISLWQALLQGLSGVATLNNQQAIINLLQQLVPAPQAETGSFNPASAVIT